MVQQMRIVAVKWLKNYGWQLVDVEKTGNPVLPVDCVFEGETEFPKSYYDSEEQEYD